jgi:hypothetical protein
MDRKIKKNKTCSLLISADGSQERIVKQKKLKKPTPLLIKAEGIDQSAFTKCGLVTFDFRSDNISLVFSKKI